MDSSPRKATAAGYKAQAAAPVDARWLPWTAAAAQTLYVTGSFPGYSKLPKALLVIRLSVVCLTHCLPDSACHIVPAICLRLA
ncbi:hypothetical protein WJX77_006028 [Trebouxia sp. C0004]